MSYLLGLDLGSGSGRAVIVNSETGESFSASVAWTHPVMPGSMGFEFDLDTTDIWNKIALACRRVMKRAGIKPGDISGIATTSMRHGIVVIDGAGNPLMATPAVDARAAMESITLVVERGRELYEITGRWPCPVFAACRLMWMKSSMPEAFSKASAYLSVADWIGFKLTGTVAIEASLAAESMAYDINRREWSRGLIDSYGLPISVFPKVVSSGEVIGTLEESAAHHLGLAAGIPVSAGGSDTQCGLLGSGVTAPGQLGIIAGTTVPLMMISDNPLIDPENKLWTGLSLIPGQYVLESNSGPMGTTLDLFARIMTPDRDNAAEVLMAEAAQASPGSNGLVSTLGAQVFNGSDLSVPVGNLSISYMSLLKGSGRSDTARSIVEGMAFALRANIESITRVAGNPPKEIRVTGGLTQAGIFTQILSDVMNKVLGVTNPQATCIGAAIAAGVGAGVFKSLEEGAGKLGRIIREPAPSSNSGKYQGLYQGWTGLLAPAKQLDSVTGGIILNAIMGETETCEVKTDLSFRPKIFISAEVDEMSLESLKALGDVEYASYREARRLLTGMDLVKALEGVNIFITEVDVVDAKSLAKLTDLRMIVVCRADPVNIDIKAATEFGIPVVNTPGRNALAVADLATAYILNLARKIIPADAFIREPGSEAGDMGRMGQAHDAFQGHELAGLTIGLVGLGAVGRETAKRLNAFGAKILAYDPFISREKAIIVGAEKAELDELFAMSDIVSLHAPVTDGTRGMINTQSLNKMKDGACLVNTARAALVDYDALLEALKSGKIAGAALDVFNVEPPAADDPLVNMPNVIVTPHIGGNTVEVAAHQGRIALKAVSTLLKGGRPQCLLNPDALKEFCWTEKSKMPTADVLEKLIRTPGASVTDLEAGGKRQKQAVSSCAADISGADESIREHMLNIIKLFTSRIEADAELKIFATDKDVVMLFIMTDLGLPFYLLFREGEVKAEAVEPAEADVVLKMKADILDGMFTGRVSGMDAAMSGKLSFSGDTAKAMTFQQIQKDMMRLYQEVRASVGDPGDLTKIGKTNEPKPPAAVQAVAFGAPAIIKIGDIRDDLLQVTNELYALGLITATGGNLSVRIPDRPDELWITPSHIFKGDLQPDMMVRIDINGKPLDDCGYPASSERHMHASIYRLRPDVNAVVHSHPPLTTILDLSGTPFRPVNTEVAFISDLPVVPFIMPGSKELADAVAAAIGIGPAVIMRNHGLIIGAVSLRRAADMTEVIEATSKTLLACRSLGVTPPEIPHEVVERLRSLSDMMA
jgi:sugar (pentulose or hexulose) kinase/phosphoglycerate dehydrogenase-like enzyme/ribulose-5-phosphate 4-epimerase/fuculose-1-phosphate aldolase/putative sterol carrier protein